MQATMTVDRSRIAGRTKAFAKLAIALATAFALGFGLGCVTAPGAATQQPIVKYVPVTDSGDQPSRAPSHGSVW